MSIPGLSTDTRIERSKEGDADEKRQREAVTVGEAPTSCCAPSGRAALRTRNRPRRPSCCRPPDAERLSSPEPPPPDAESVSASWVSAELKYAMYMPALRAHPDAQLGGSASHRLAVPPGVKQVLDSAHLVVGSRILECGASLGQIALLAAEIAGPAGEAHLAQLDPTLALSSRAFVASHDMDRAVEVFKASCERIPSPSEYYDAVIADRAVGCLHTQLEKQQQLINELVRVTRPGGHLVLVEAVPTGVQVPDGARIPECIRNAPMVRWPVQVLSMFRSAGLSEIRVTRIPITRMSTAELCQKAGVPYSDAYMEFVVMAGRKEGVAPTGQGGI